MKRLFNTHLLGKDYQSHCPKKYQHNAQFVNSVSHYSIEICRFAVVKPKRRDVHLFHIIQDVNSLYPIRAVSQIKREIKLSRS